MSPFRPRLSITPETAIKNFLVDMRLAAERSFRGWERALVDGFANTTLSPADRRDLITPHPLEDYFFAGLVGLQAAAVRESFGPIDAEALLRQVALQVDQAAGRSDRLVSIMVFTIFGRIRKNAGLDPAIPRADVVTDVVLERLAMDRMSATHHLARRPAYRAALNKAVTARPLWWDAFGEVYRVEAAARPRPTYVTARETFLTRRTAASRLFEEFAPPPSPPLPTFMQRLGEWLTPRPHTH